MERTARAAASHQISPGTRRVRAASFSPPSAGPPAEMGGDQAYRSSRAQHRPQQVESLHLPNVLIQAVEIIVEAGLSAAVQLEIRHRLLPEGHVDGHIRRVLPGREILIAGDVP